VNSVEFLFILSHPIPSAEDPIEKKLNSVRFPIKLCIPPVGESTTKEVHAEAMVAIKEVDAHGIVISDKKSC
jgi:hypothetical protein